jgi:hypothetical protein
LNQKIVLRVILTFTILERSNLNFLGFYLYAQKKFVVTRVPLKKFERTCVPLLETFFFLTSMPFPSYSYLDQTMDGKVQNTLNTKYAIIIT